MKGDGDGPRLPAPALEESFSIPWKTALIKRRNRFPAYRTKVNHPTNGRIVLLRRLPFEPPMTKGRFEASSRIEGNHLIDRVESDRGSGLESLN
jgi:hypothetical protein